MSRVHVFKSKEMKIPGYGSRSGGSRRRRNNLRRTKTSDRRRKGDSGDGNWALEILIGGGQKNDGTGF